MNEINPPWMLQARKLMNVKRCGTFRTINSQSVAEHSYYVALLSFDIANYIESNYEEDWKIDKSVLLLKALLHDVEEGITGDIPHPMKNTFPFLKEGLDEGKRKILSEYFPSFASGFAMEAKKGKEGEIVEIADYVELYHYCVEEKLSGNRQVFLDDIMKTCRSIFLLKSIIIKETSDHYFDNLDKILKRGGLNDRRNHCYG